MLNSYYRIPSWNVRIQRPDFDSNTVKSKSVPEWSKTKEITTTVSFSSSRDKAAAHNIYNDLISYSYTNSISDPSGGFNLTLTLNTDNLGRSWKDKLQRMDMVIIQEFDRDRYVGFITNVKYSMEMGSNGEPKRSVTVTGISFGGMIQKYNLTLNVYLWYNNGQTANSLNTDLIQALNSKVNESQDLNKILSLITEKFFSVVFGSQELKGFILWINKFVTFETMELESYYPRVLSVFQIEQNNLWDIYRQVLTSPVYEIFGKWEMATGSYKIMCRETPFDYDDWNDLKITELNPLFLISHNFTDGMDQVFTHYYSTIPNGEFSENENNARADLTNVSVFDNPKLWIFGYNKLQASFSFYNVDRGEEISFSSEDFLLDNSKRMYNWYHNNDEFESGEIVLMSVPDKNNDLIDIGERISVVGGEFYIESYTRSMSYPQSMKTTLKVTRGYEYGKTTLKKDDTIQTDSGGNIIYTPQKGKIRNVTQKLAAMEKEAQRG